MTKRSPNDLPPKPAKREIPPAPGSGRVRPRRKMTPAARLGSQVVFVVLIVIILGVVTYPIWHGVLFPDPVTTRFSQLPAEQQKAINSLPPEQRTLLLELAEQNPQQAADTALALLDIPLRIADDIGLFGLGQAPIIKQGTFTQQNALYGAVGTVQIYQKGSSYILSLKDFEVTMGPELHFGLAPDAAPIIDSRATWLDLGVLKGQAGSIVFPLPNTVDISRFNSVVIFDSKYNTLSSWAPLTQ